MADKITNLDPTTSSTTNKATSSPPNRPRSKQSPENQSLETPSREHQNTANQGSNVLNAFQKHQGALRRFISRFVQRPQDIDDVAQEAFMRAYCVEKGKPIEQPKSFLFRIAHNVAITELTKKSHQIIDYIADIDESAVVWLEHSAEDQVMAEELIGIHCEAVAQLPPQCRRVFLMRKVHGMSHKDISAELGISISTVEKHISKGIRDCANFIDQRTNGENDNKQSDERAEQRHG